MASGAGPEGDGPGGRGKQHGGNANVGPGLNGACKGFRVQGLGAHMGFRT